MTIINEVKLATQLAEREIENTYSDYEDAIYEIDEQNAEVYTHKFQGIFNALYDEFYTMIRKCK